jgi:hypothetical protein
MLYKLPSSFRYKITLVVAALITSVIFIISCNSTSVPDDVKKQTAIAPETIDYNLHVKPILSDRCFSCHGPDKNTRKADLRLDTEEGARAALKSGNGKAIVPGSLGKSELVHRILSDDPVKMMPPSNSNLYLSPFEKAVLVKWVEQGAAYKKHWAFIPPVKPEIPKTKNSNWIAYNPIDYFIQSTLESKGLTPSPIADKERLIRRVTLDLTGLPPTIEEIDAFVNDKAPNAYQKLVDRLLATDAYAERMAMDWMDVARYADSHGMHADGWRYMWPWRDWVIKAFKENMPYDKFSTWQIAGDMLPNATREQILATAFNRNHPMTAEGGAIDEEFRLKYVFDRANTIGTAFLALTLECSQCHDHKFDPLSQKDYYSFTSFFNNVKELGMTGDDGNYGPMLLLTNDSTEKQLQFINTGYQSNYKQLKLSEKEIADIKNYITQTKTSTNSTADIYLAFEKLTNISKPSDKQKVFKIDNSKSGYVVGDGVLKPGKNGNAIFFANEFDQVVLSKTGNYEANEPFAAAAWINTTKKEKGQTQTIIGNSQDKNEFWRGWDFFLDTANRVSVRLIHSLPHNYIQVTTNETVNLKTWTHLAFTYDGFANAEGISIFINGKKVPVQVEYDRLYKTIKKNKPTDHPPMQQDVVLGKSYRTFTGDNGIFKGMMDDVYLWSRQVSSLEIYKAYNASLLPSVEMQKHHAAIQSPSYQAAAKETRQLIGKKIQLLTPVPEIMVMEEMKQPRKTHVLQRGQYDMPAEPVVPATPAAVLNFDSKYPRNRLGLSQWLFDERNPLTARVTVNRYWQMFFGRGLVKTTHDFGNQGNMPTHPELLDWLAVNFREEGWDVKKLVKLIVTSATYMQNSHASKQLQETDPENIYLARGPKFRLSAETIRDNALAVSGLLVKKVGGESVKPYQPEGLWKEKSNFSFMLLEYIQGKGDDLYRRTMYSFIRRTSPPPSLLAFDAGARDVCTVKREATNTPLQALVLLNDVQYVEAARVLAVRLQKEAGADVTKQIELLFRLTTSRKPKADETTQLTQLYTAQLEKFRKNPAAASKLLSQGEYPVANGIDRIKTAALTIVSSTMLNHDECYTKR